jgi:hypothetical protein
MTGIERVRPTRHPAYSFLRHTGLSAHDSSTNTQIFYGTWRPDQWGILTMTAYCRRGVQGSGVLSECPVHPWVISRVVRDRAGSRA